MRKALPFLFLLLVGLGWAATLSVADLRRHHRDLDGESVTVHGRLMGFRQEGEERTPGFLLFDQGQSVSIYAPDQTGLINNKAATVTGTFWVERELGERTYNNVIEATSVDQ